MIIGTWDKSTKSRIQDNRKLENALSEFLEKRCSIEKVLTELSSSVNNNSILYVIRDFSGCSSTDSEPFQIMNFGNSPEKKLWYCYTSIERIKIAFYRKYAVAIDAGRFFSCALNSNVTSIWINPSAPVCTSISSQGKKCDVERVFNLETEALKKEYLKLALIYSSSNGKVDKKTDLCYELAEEDQEYSNAILFKQALDSMVSNETILLVDNEQMTYYEITPEDRDVIRYLSNKNHFIQISTMS